MLGVHYDAMLVDFRPDKRRIPLACAKLAER
jgi:hypothetical protein